MMLNKYLLLYILDSLNVRKKIAEATGSDLKTHGQFISKTWKFWKPRAIEEKPSDYKRHWVRIR